MDKIKAVVAFIKVEAEIANFISFIGWEENINA